MTDIFFAVILNRNKNDVFQKNLNIKSAFNSDKTFVQKDYFVCFPGDRRTKMNRANR